MEEFINVGKRIPKMDAEEKVTGKAIYIHDLKVPGMLYGKILYSPHPHAKIKSIDTSKGRKTSRGEGCFNGLQHSSNQIRCL